MGASPKLGQIRTFYAAGRILEWKAGSAGLVLKPRGIISGAGENPPRSIGALHCFLSGCCKLPLAGAGSESSGMGGPVVEGGRIEVRPARPDQGVNFRIDADLIE